MTDHPAHSPEALTQEVERVQALIKDLRIAGKAWGAALPASARMVAEAADLLESLSSRVAEVERERADEWRRRREAEGNADVARASRDAAEQDLRLTQAALEAKKTLLASCETALTAAESSHEALKQRVETCEAALRELAKWRLADGTSCWCGAALHLFTGPHSPGCLAARAALSKRTAEQHDGPDSRDQAQDEASVK